MGLFKVCSLYSSCYKSSFFLMWMRAKLDWGKASCRRRLLGKKHSAGDVNQGKRSCWRCELGQSIMSESLRNQER